MRQETPSERMLTFRSGGWLLAITGALVLGITLWRVWIMQESFTWKGGEVPGRSATNGFDLSTSLVPVTRITPSGLRRDGLRSLSDPEVISLEEATELSQGRKKFLTSQERVIGVTVGGEPRAYPIRFLNWHEVVNDTLGGQAILVTYSPWCDSVAIFRRDVRGRTREFGVSGLLLDSNLLCYDRLEEGESSLWSQLQARAVTGPAAAEGLRLERLPGELVTWESWSERHPRTTVLAGIPSYFKKVYNKKPYGAYFITGKLQYPVENLPPEGERALFDRLLAVTAGDTTEIYFLSDLIANATEGRWSTTQSGVPLTFHVTEAPETARVEGSPGVPPPLTTPCFWFAWFASQSSSGSD